MFYQEIVKHYANELCPSCRSHDKIKIEYIGKLVKRKSKFGAFLGCSRYPKCKYTSKIVGKYEDEFDGQQKHLRSIMKSI